MDRKKAARKTLLFYRIHADFKPPYKVLIDDPFVGFCARRKIDLEDQLKKLIGIQDVEIGITQCCWSNLVKGGNETAIKLGKRFRKYFCNHKAIHENQCLSPEGGDHVNSAKNSSGVVDSLKEDGQPAAQSTSSGQVKEKLELLKRHVELSSKECLKSYAGKYNMNKYIFGVHNSRAVASLRQKKNTPVICFVHEQMMMAEPSPATRKYHNKQERKKRKMPRWEKNLVGGTESVVLHRSKRVKGPNPLSCKKKTEREVSEAQSTCSRKTRCRSKSHRKRQSEKSTNLL